MPDDERTHDQQKTRRQLARWASGMAITSGKYVVHRVPLYRRNRRHDDEPEVPDLEREVCGDPATVQRASAGLGSLYHRRYEIRFTDGDLSCAELIAQLRNDPNSATPREISAFDFLSGEPPIDEGDELLVRLPGPWDGPVRCVAATDTSFTLCTLDGHMEAGQISFSARLDERGWTVFTIESFARSGDKLFHFLYDRLPVARELQLHMWALFCEEVVDLAGGIAMTNVELHTCSPSAERGADGDRDGDGEDDRGPERSAEQAAADSDRDPVRVTGRVSPRARRVLDDLHDKGLNFDLDERASFTEANGWHVDQWCQPLPSERPGEPEPGGSWERCRELLTTYEFADPSIVRAVYRDDQPLEERDMVLEGRFYGLRFHMGLRVGGINDLTDEVEGRPVRRWGWNYRTLQGHLEMGQMDYEVWKWTDTGAVEFRIDAFSRAAHIPNPIVRLGFALFGRMTQKRFARRALTRMERLVREQLAPEAQHREAPLPPTLTELEVHDSMTA